MNDATCHFCHKNFRNRQAVRAHLRHCVAYRRRQSKPRPPRRRPPERSLPIGRSLPIQADEPQVELEPVDDTQPHVQDAQVRPPQTSASELGAWLETHEKRRKEEAAEARKQRRRAIIQRVKDRVIGQWWSSRYAIPAETKAQALLELDRALMALAVDELPERELVQIAEGIRDRLYGPVTRAQDAARRLEQHRRQEVQVQARQAAEQRAREVHQEQQAEETRTLGKQRLLRDALGLARQELDDVEDLDPRDRQEILAGVQRELEAALTGSESKRDVEARVDEILDAELGDAEGDDEGVTDDWDEEDDDEDDDIDEDEDDS